MKTKGLVGVHVRLVIRRDLPEVLATEKDCDHPWDEQALCDHLGEPNVVGMVAEVDGRAVGHMVYSLHKRRIDLLRLGVHKAHRRAGVGTALMDKAKDKVGIQRRILRVDAWDGNLPLHLFLRSQGMTAIGVERGALLDEADAYRFEWPSERKGN